MRNTRAFLSFQIVQETSMVREAIARLFGFHMSVLLSHHCMRESSRCQLEVSMCTRPNLSMTDRQSLMEKRHLTKRWMPDSCSRLQSGQSPQLSQPRRSNLSAVQFRSCKVNHAKNLTLGGASSPNHVVNGRVRQAMELRLICCGRRVLPIISMFPNNVVLNVIVKMEVMHKCPKREKFLDVCGGDNSGMLDVGHPSVPSQGLAKRRSLPF